VTPQATTRRPVPRRQADRRQQTRQRLLSAAGRVFAKRGYYGATLDEVAAAAGLTKGAVYYNFQSKEDLFLVLLEERLGDRLDDVRRTLSSEHVVAGGGVSVAQDFLGKLERDPRWNPLFFEFVAFAARDAKVRRAFGRRFFRAARGALAEVISRLFKQTEIAPSIPPEQLAIAVGALANGLTLERLFTPNEVPDELFGQILELLFRALSAER
jgi:AcrR family transcriptional regulator